LSFLCCRSPFFFFLIAVKNWCRYAHEQALFLHTRYLSLFYLSILSVSYTLFSFHTPQQNIRDDVASMEETVVDTQMQLRQVRDAGTPCVS
jgi:hypothetical protein